MMDSLAPQLTGCQPGGVGRCVCVCVVDTDWGVLDSLALQLMTASRWGTLGARVRGAGNA